MKSSHHILLSLGIAALVACTRWFFECLVVVPLVPDPQNPIWIMISTITCIFIFVSVAPLAWLAFRGLESQSTTLKALAWAPLILLLGWYSIGFIDLARMRTALLDAADPTTGADRLRELANYKGGPGYEIDNRVAQHPNSPPDVLQSLHGRPDQVGTEMCLAQNPNTPDDVLLAIAKRNDKWSKLIEDSLKRNPRFAELIAAQAVEADEEAEAIHEPKSK